MRKMRDAIADRLARGGRLCVALCTLILILGSGIRSASAVTIFSNETGLSSPGGYVVGQYIPGQFTDFAIGWQFTVPSTGPHELQGGTFGGSYAYGTNSLMLQVATNNSGVPGAILASTVLANVLTSNLSFVGFVMTPKVDLIPSATYWLLASVTDPSSRVYWWTPNIAPGNYPETVSYNGNPYGPGSNERPGMFSITAVPEPAGWTLMLVGLSVLAFCLSVARGAAAIRPPSAGHRPPHPAHRAPPAAHA
jgi:hypothetical protein